VRCDHCQKPIERNTPYVQRVSPVDDLMTITHVRCDREREELRRDREEARVDAALEKTCRWCGGPDDHGDECRGMLGL
jgi:hypothetical protein